MGQIADGEENRGEAKQQHGARMITKNSRKGKKLPVPNKLAAGSHPQRKPQLSGRQA
jgi:hypothetical protein